MLFWYAFACPKHLPAYFQLLAVPPRWNNPCCLELSRSIAVSHSPAKSALTLSRATPQISPVAGSHTLFLPYCLLIPFCFPHRFPVTLTYFHGSCVLGGLLSLTQGLASRTGLFPGEEKCRYACNSFAPVPAQLSRWGGWASPHKEGTPPPQMEL